MIYVVHVCFIKVSYSYWARYLVSECQIGWFLMSQCHVQVVWLQIWWIQDPACLHVHYKAGHYGCLVLATATAGNHRPVVWCSMGYGSLVPFNQWWWCPRGCPPCQPAHVWGTDRLSASCPSPLPLCPLLPSSHTLPYISLYTLTCIIKLSSSPHLLYAKLWVVMATQELPRYKHFLFSKQVSCNTDKTGFYILPAQTRYLTLQNNT